MTEMSQEVRAAMLILTSKEADAFALHWAGMGYRSISRALSIGETTARDRVRRAHSKVARYLDEQEDKSGNAA
jgi:DNA-directed RNA polymerase specialized sigma24 family protein